MNVRLRLSAFLLVCMPAVILAEAPEKLLEETSKMLEETTTALTGVKDAAGANAVLPKLDRLDEQMKKMEKEIVRLSKANPDKPEREWLKAWRLLDRVKKPLEKELMRLDTDPITHKVLRDQAVVQKFRKAKETIALIDVQGLSALCETFKLNNGKYPKKIEDLGMKQPDGGLPLTPMEKLRDPWGQLYRCDGAGKQNKGKRCDVWSVGHPIVNRAIGNWMKKLPSSDPAKDKMDEKKDKGTGKDRKRSQ